VRCLDCSEGLASMPKKPTSGHVCLYATDHFVCGISVNLVHAGYYIDTYLVTTPPCAYRHTCDVFRDAVVGKIA
jgi:hypothetical protein